MPTTALRFVLDREPVTDAEGRRLASDLLAQGLDARFWTAMNGLIATASRSDTPLVLRGYRGGDLVAVAHLIECRRTNQCLFPGWLGRLLDLVPVPGYCWVRGDPAVDLLASPGVLAEGEDREAFYEAAVAFLNARYRFGSVLEARGTRAAAACYETVMMDWGRYEVAPGGVERLLRAHRHLHRKEARFRNKGGRVEVQRDALGTADRDAVLACLGHSAGRALVRAPFQENYANMVRWAAGSGAPGILHVIARLDGTLVGYHTFLHSGRRLQCLSGGFDRSRHTTYHAYENILLAAMRYAEAHAIERVAFGPVGNPSKAAVMPAFTEYVLRFYSRSPAMLGGLSLVVPRSAVRPAVFAGCSGLGRPQADQFAAEAPAAPLGRRPARV